MLVEICKTFINALFEFENRLKLTWQLIVLLARVTQHLLHTQLYIYFLHYFTALHATKLHFKEASVDLRILKFI